MHFRLSILGSASQVLYMAKIVGMLLATGATAEVGGRFGNGRGPIILHNTLCIGSEQRLFDCESQIYTVPSCSRAAGLTCLPGILVVTT